MKIAAGLSVKIEYELRVKGGDIVESSSRSGPLRYVHGRGKMLPGLEKRLEGLAAGDERRGEIPAAEAFGTEESLPVREIPRTEFPASAKLEPGAVFEAKSATGEPVRLKLIGVAGGTVRARLLHPLVGRDLTFTVKVLSVTDPTPPPPPGVVELDPVELEDIQET
jgi:FKBP-type peptidyl-prolyl cis-trans isomerase SlyD